MKKTLIIVSAIALSLSVLASGNPDKAAACSKDAGVKKASCVKDNATCKMDKAACDAKRAACEKEAAKKKASCGGCPLSK